MDEAELVKQLKEQVESRAKSWSEFISQIKKATVELGSPDLVWYRGQSKTEYRLVPSLLRHKNGAGVETAVFEEYTKSAHLLHKNKDDDWLTLADMQHYGVPTRLLDWSDALGVAVAFAVLDGSDEEHSSVYILDPKNLNKRSGIGHRVMRVPDQHRKFDYRSMFLGTNTPMPENPIAIDCAFESERLRSQNGTFTVHGIDLHPFEASASPYSRKVVLGAEAKLEAREFLEFANINAFKLYPDFVGMATHLKYKFFS